MPVSTAELTTDADLVKGIAQTVETYGQDREAILGQLLQVLGVAPDDDQIAVVEAFLAGARLPSVTSVL